MIEYRVTMPSSEGSTFDGQYATYAEALEAFLRAEEPATLYRVDWGIGLPLGRFVIGEKPSQGMPEGWENADAYGSWECAIDALRAEHMRDRSNG